MKELDYYEHDGKKYWRVTSILHAYQFPDDYEGGIDKKTLNAAARFGTQVHRMIEEPGWKPARLSNEHRNCMEAHQRYVKDWGEPIMAEQERRVYYDGPVRIGCTIDLVEPEAVTDWKTSRRLMMRHRVQVNAYSKLLAGPSATTSMDMRDVRLVRLDKHLGDYEKQEFKFSWELWDVFMKLAQVYVMFRE